MTVTVCTKCISWRDDFDLRINQTCIESTLREQNPNNLFDRKAEWRVTLLKSNSQYYTIHIQSESLDVYEYLVDGTMHKLQFLRQYWWGDWSKRKGNNSGTVQEPRQSTSCWLTAETVSGPDYQTAATWMLGKLSELSERVNVEKKKRSSYPKWKALWKMSDRRWALELTEIFGGSFLCLPPSRGRRGHRRKRTEEAKCTESQDKSDPLDSIWTWRGWTFWTCCRFREIRQLCFSTLVWNLIPSHCGWRQSCQISEITFFSPNQTQITRYDEETKH